MKTLFLGQVKGLIWFVVAYALIRVALSGSGAAIQGEALAIIIGSVAFIWLLFPIIMGEYKALMSVSFFALSGYSLFTWTKLDPGIFSISWFQGVTANSDKIALLVSLLILITAIVIVILDLLTLRKEKGLWMAPVWLVVIVVIIAAIDNFLPMIVNAINTSSPKFPLG